MRYAVYWTWKKDGMQDSDIAHSAQQRDTWIREMLKRGEHKEIAWCQIKADGEYGRRIRVETE